MTGTDPSADGPVWWREPDGIFLVSEAGGRRLASFFAEGGGFIARPNGTELRVWLPGAEPEAVARRVLREWAAVRRSGRAGAMRKEQANGPTLGWIG